MRGPGSQCVMGPLANRDEISVFYVPIAAAGDRPERVYSVEKLSFGAEAIFQFCGNAAENLRKTRRTADLQRLRPVIVDSNCSLESRKFPAFYSATIFPPNTRRELFNGIGPTGLTRCAGDFGGGEPNRFSDRRSAARTPSSPVNGDRH
jgi:hypothetical protein